MLPDLQLADTPAKDASAMKAMALLRFTCAVLLMCSTARPLMGQSTPFEPPLAAGSAIPITIVLVDNGSRPGLIRRANGEPRNVVLLDSATADVQVLSDAVFSMLIMEAVDGDGRRRNDREVQRASLSANRPVYPWAEEALRRLNETAKEPVRGVGRHRALTIWMPPLRGYRQ
jgi:hypothetical protein